MKIHACLISAGALLCASASTFAVSSPSTLLARDLDGDAATVEAHYDTELRITWLADARALSGSRWDEPPYPFSDQMPPDPIDQPAERAAWEAQNYSYRHDGLTRNDSALAWASMLSVGGITGWRLPATFVPVDPWPDGAPCPCQQLGTATSSELSHLYLETLGGHPESGPFGLGPTGDLWTNTPLELFSYGNGGLEVSLAGSGKPERTTEAFALAVHDGDIGSPISVVPEPSSVLLLLTGLPLLYRRRITR